MPLTRLQAQAVEDYCQVVKTEDVSIPSLPALVGMSTLIDEAATGAFRNYDQLQTHSPAILAGALEVEKAPTVCGGFKRPKKILLKGLTAHEQMKVLSQVLSTHNFRKKHTYAFMGHEDNIIPLWIEPSQRNQEPADLFHCVIGRGARGTLKKFKYPDWEEMDPKNSEYATVIDTANSLEMYRQPHLTGSLLLKAAAYEADHIEHTWRYQVGKKPFYSLLASVEIPGQKHKTRHIQHIVDQSAGHNFAQMIQKLGVDTNLLPERHYEAFAADGYKDDNIPTLTPEQILDTFPQALKGNTEPLNIAMAKLFATRVQIPSIPETNALAIQSLFN